MSKDNPNLRLLGSPVNLSYRSKKKDDKKNVRNRPRSALQNSYFTPDNQERYKRPFSADAKERLPAARPFYKQFSSELLNNAKSCPLTTIKVVAPTTELLGSASDSHCVRKDKDICSNASDYGSEDTFISLGTKIKARAQLGGGFRARKPAAKNILKYRNIAKKGKKQMEGTSEDKTNEYGMEIRITERPERAYSPSRSVLSERSLSPTFRKAYDTYFVPLNNEKKKIDEDALAGRVSFGTSSNVQADVEQAIDVYSRRLTMTKQQLSLVEEESTQDNDASSQHLPSLSPEYSLENNKKEENYEGDLTGRNTYVVDSKDDFSKPPNYVNETQTYTSFYDDIRASSAKNRPTKMSSTLHTDSSSKDSGYPESGSNERPNLIQCYRQTSSSLNTMALKKSKSHDKLEKQLNSSSSHLSSKSYNKTFPGSKRSPWAEPVNHSRLLYKDFFIQKEHVPSVPQNSTDNVQTIPNEIAPETVNEAGDDNVHYPSYLRNSTTKAYTSKVIEDYKKELEAINNLHELTLKDIRTDPISPTPFNIDQMFEQQTFPDKAAKDNSSGSQSSSKSQSDDRNTLSTERDISKISTKELIQNYLKVKESDYTKDYMPKSIKKHDKQMNSALAKVEKFKQDWNNKSFKSNSPTPKAVNNIKNHTQNNVFTVHAPLSSRIESVQMDRDVDSWMSLSAPSPRVLEIDDTELNTGRQEPIAEIVNNQHEGSPRMRHQSKELTSPQIPHQTELQSPRNRHQTNETSERRPEVTSLSPQASTSFSKEKEAPRPKELDSNSTVFDIYSMLKDIETYCENPVAAPQPVEQKTEESHPKDNFLEIFQFLEKVEQSANDALSVVTSTTPQTVPKLELLLKLPQTELAQRLVTASLQLEERSCCIALLQESLANHKQQMVTKVSNLEKQSHRNVNRIKLECEEAIKRHQSFIDQLINDKKTLNHRIEQLVDERRTLEERWKRSAQALEDRYKLELRNQHDKMAAAQQVARQRWVRQKADKIKELTVKGLEGELREMAERQQKDISDMKMSHAEHLGKIQSRHAAELEQLRRTLEEEKEAALLKERQVASSRLEKQILELELSYQEQRTRLVAEMRAENERRAHELAERERGHRREMEIWREEQEKILHEKKAELQEEILREKCKLEEEMRQKQTELEQKFEQYKKDFEAEQQVQMRKKTAEIAAQHKLERDREIEKAIESMDAEAQAGRRELQEALRRNKEQYEAELKELAETEQATLRRYQDAQARVRQTEDRCAELEVMVSQLETRNKVLTEKNTQLEQQAAEVRARVDEACRQKVDDLRREMDELKRTHEEQMHQLYAKVKVAVARKDSAIQALTRESAKYQEKVTLLEQKLQQQRKDFLKQK